LGAPPVQVNSPPKECPRTLDTVVVLAVLASAVALFASGRLPADLVAVLIPVFRPL
jgi:hypothetical protein